MSSAPNMSTGKQYSLVLHALFLLLMIFGLPDFMHRRLEREPQAISVDILPIAPMSNVKPQEKSEPEPQKKPIEEKKTERKATVESKKVEQKPQEKPEPIKAKDVVKVPDKKLEKAQKKNRTDDLDSVLKSVEQTAKAEESKHPTQTVTPPNQNAAKSETYDSSLPLSMSEKDAIRQQLERCWSVPAGAKNAADLVVNLHIAVSEDGTITEVELSGDQGRYNSDSFFRAAADSAIRGVRECSPLKNLPVEKYGTWHDMELTFDPKDML